MLLAAVTLVAATGAGAALSPSYQVAGIELGGGQTVSAMTGLGVGSAGDRSFWQTSVNHDALANCSSVGTSCAITGGTFTVRSNTGSMLAATYAGGTFQLSYAAPGCGRQQYAITGNLTSSAGPLVLTAVLTEYRFQFRGQCAVLLSTVQGSLAPGVSGGGGGGDGQL